MPKRKDTRPQARPKVCRYFDTREVLRKENTTDARKRAKEMLTHWSGRHIPKDTRGYYSKRGKHPMRGSYGRASFSQARARISGTIPKPHAEGGKRKVQVRRSADFACYR